MKVLLALLFVTAMATLDLRPQVNAATASFQSGASAELEDGPDGEEAPLAIFLRSFDGDDQIGPDAPGVRITRIAYLVAAPDLCGDPAGPSHPPFAGFPTGPPRA